MTIGKAPCSTPSPSVPSVNGAKYLKSVKKGVDTQFRGKSEPRASFRWCVPVGGHSNGTLILTDEQTSLRLSPSFLGYCVSRGVLKRRGSCPSRPLRRVARRCSRDPVSSTIGHSRHFCTPYFCEKMNPSLFSLRPRKKAGELATTPSLPSFLRQFQFTFRCPTRFLHPTRTHPFS
jgi:hypothetical protein